MRAAVIPAAAIARAGEDVEAGFEPLVEAVRNLDRLMPGMMRWQSAVGGGLCALRGEIVMQLDHRNAARHGFRSIDLDFIIVLRANGCRCYGDRGTCEKQSKYCLVFQQSSS